MKISSTLLLCLGIIWPAYSQTTLFQSNQPHSVVTLDPQSPTSDAVPGQILVKFKDKVAVNAGTDHGIARSGLASVDEVLRQFQVKSINKLFMNAEPLQQKQTLKSFNGKTFDRPSLHNIYKLDIGNPGLVHLAIEALKHDEQVEFAEPNYVLSIVEAKPESGILTESDVKNMNGGNNLRRNTNVVTPNDPLYSQQWYIPAIHADAVWDSTTGDTTKIIAILDTGVDWLHPDLQHKIWTNAGEIPGNGIDDDGNGFVDDVRGWDFINNDNNPADDNSHGTHVAGIAAADGNNGIGIAGVSWGAKIMPIKVFQSSGRGDAATIAQGIWYAAHKGATIINMSFGGYSRSQTMEDALAYAYATSVLVAAAGNDNHYIGAKPDCHQQPPYPFFPAALSYVLGVQADGGCGMGFTNYDDDPVYTDYPELFNYELKAPGSSILSTVPNGNYRMYDGTSMAAPVVAGAICLYESLHPNDSQELLWGNLIHATSQYLDIDSAIHIMPKPQLSVISNTLVDTLSGDNGNGTIDAGETIQLWVLVRNAWGQANSAMVRLAFGEFEDTTTAQILKDTAFIGSISPYGTRSNEGNPFVMHISQNIANGRQLVFECSVWNAGSPDTTRQRIVLTASNGSYLGGVMDSTFTLTPDKLWIVNQSYRVGVNGILHLSPGTHLILQQDMVDRGSIIANGTADSTVIITGPGSIKGPGGGNFLHTTFQELLSAIGGELAGYSGGTFSFDHCHFESIRSLPPSGSPFESYLVRTGTVFMRDCLIRDCSLQSLLLANIGEFTRNVVSDCYFYPWNGGMTFIPGSHNTFVNILDYQFTFTQFGPVNHGIFMTSGDWAGTSNNFVSFGPGGMYAIETAGTRDVIGIPGQYWGTTNSSRIKNKIYDFWKDPVLPMADFSSFRTAATDSAHGIVWKVLVDGTDPQDQHLDPLGPGTHRFDIYFNCPMNTTYTPLLTFGVREPYTQHAVVDSAHWSADHKVWTAWHTVQLYTGDGVNRIRVASAQDLDRFEIPVEDKRFEFLISAAGSSSVGFSATAGLGKVNLGWEKPSLPDLLGYNMYRFTTVTDSTFTLPALVNTSLLTDTTYTDFGVTPNRRYYYYYKVVRTDFTESDSSQIVSAMPLTAAHGDANGDLSINVLDVVSIVSYILGQNPQPFIFAAADFNSDGTINVLDIVGVVNVILHGSAKGTVAQASGNARVELAGNRLTLTTDVPIAGVQVRFSGTGAGALRFTPEGHLTQFEIGNAAQGDTARTYVMYNLAGMTLPAGSYTLGTFEGMNQGIALAEAFLSNEHGGSVVTSVLDNGVPLIPTEFYLNQNYPNPFNSATTIRYGVPVKTEVAIVLYNILGQRVRTFDIGEVNPGRYTIVWDGRNDHGAMLASGVYLYRLQSPPFTNVKKLLMLK